MSRKILVARYFLVASAVVLLGALIWFMGNRTPAGDSTAATPSPPVFSPDPEEEALTLGEAPPPEPTPPTRAPASSSPTRVIVERIGVDAPVITLGLDQRNIPEVPDDIWAKNTGGASARTVVAWYDFSPMPGQRGNTVLAGHVTWDKQQAVFWDPTSSRWATSFGSAPSQGTTSSTGSRRISRWTRRIPTRFGTSLRPGRRW